ncbi:O-antigen ligase family protein [Gracilibacillus dipsosauri]|uniref:O-antigen ligase-related domain-containing protein n=1 Tax=Gracilibacillus dipsosauri TaxID=178340 RepID=A0A317KVY1_9BACI|nr:O-antigen ligase family protein [Gracilibacillus dipsosauri]PWU66588.1 hypothetical protein DLJ74_19395 [Gracilibacillus dipsosauri]
MRLFKFLFKGEVVFAGFILSSTFKGIIPYSPFDLTVLFMVWSFFIALKRVMRNPTLDKVSILPIVLYFSSAIMVIFSLTYTIGGKYGTDKALMFVSLTAWSFVGVFFLIRNAESLHLFLKGIIFYSMITVCYVVFDYFSGGLVTGYNRIGIDGGNTIGLARVSGLAVLVLLVMYIYKKVHIKQKILALLMILLSITTLMLSGSRMPLIALLATIIVLFLWSISFQKVKFSMDVRISKKILLLLAAIPIMIVSLIPFINTGMFYTTIERFTSLFSGESIDSKRIELYRSAISLWEENPLFGGGIGSFPIHYWGVDGRAYPHNFFLESLSELGIFGFLFIVLLVLFSFITIWKTRKKGMNNLQLAIALIFLFLLLNANVTGDINDNRYLFTFIALTFCLNLFEYKKDTL